MKKKAAIFDIDGTLFDDSHRKHLADAKKWDEYFSAGANDPPNVAVIKELTAQIKAGRAIVLMTGCPERHKKMTVAKLLSAGISFDVLLMRPENNYAKNHDLKASCLAQLKDEYEFSVAFDDMTGSVSMFRSLGIPAHLVKDGKPVFEHGQSPKAGKGTGRKKYAPSIVISFRIPAELAEKEKITSMSVKNMLMQEIKKRHEEPPLCKWNNGAKWGSLGLCDIEPGAYPIFPGDCPCEDFEPFIK